MKVVAKKSFATRTKGYVAGMTYEVSEEEYKGFASLVEPVNAKNDAKQDNIIKTEEKPKKKAK